jgi:hypothetical protein
MPWPVVRRACARNFCAVAPHVPYARRPRGPQCEPFSSRRINQSLLLLIMACVIAQAQSTPQTLDVPSPTTSGVLGHVDPGALAEISQHLKATGSAPWTGMQGTGQITYGTDSTAYSATLTILGNKSFRLDGQTSKGLLSIRINGLQGKIQEADGRQNFIVPDTAASGIFQFQLPRLANFPGASTSLLDHGSSVVAGATLHRVTFESPVSGPMVSTQKKKTLATDLYFDGTTHLLVKSANVIHINDAGNNDFLREITYDDYRSVGNVMIPFRYIQTLNGQNQWTLQLSEVQLNPTAKATFFEF